MFVGGQMEVHMKRWALLLGSWVLVHEIKGRRRGIKVVLAVWSKL
jgi:hypothetical protein